MKKSFIKLITIICLACLLMMSVSCGPIGESRIDKIGIHSKALDKVMKVEIYVPAGYSPKKEFPVLYLFHGYTETEKNIRERGFYRVADILIDQGRIEPVIIVAPQIDNSYGLNSAETSSMMGNDPELALYAGMYEDYLINELIKYIDSEYGTIEDKSGRFIGGISMGGHTTLRLGFTHSDLFSRVGGHMPALWTDNFRESDAGFKVWLYPNEEVRGKRDPIYIAGYEDLSDISVYIDCGRDDSWGFYDGCDVLFNVLSEKGVDVQYYLKDGGHTHEYIEKNAEEYLLFYAGAGN